MSFHEQAYEIGSFAGISASTVGPVYEISWRTQDPDESAEIYAHALATLDSGTGEVIFDTITWYQIPATVFRKCATMLFLVTLLCLSECT